MRGVPRERCAMRAAPPGTIGTCRMLAERCTMRSSSGTL